MQFFETLQTFKCGAAMWKLKEFSCRPQQRLLRSCSNKNDNFAFLYPHISSNHILCKIVASVYIKKISRQKSIKIYLEKIYFCSLGEWNS